MATIANRNGNFRVTFRHHDRQRNFTLSKVSGAEARAKADQVEHMLMRLGQWLNALAPGADIVTFVRDDGTTPPAAVDSTNRPWPTSATTTLRGWPDPGCSHAS